MTDAHTNCTGQDVHWTQVYSSNRLLNLVVIWRDVSLYILWVISCSSLQSLARVTGRPSHNSGNKDGSVVKATVVQPANVGSGPIYCLLRRPLATRPWYSTILQHPGICSMAMFNVYLQRFTIYFCNFNLAYIFYSVWMQPCRDARHMNKNLQKPISK